MIDKVHIFDNLGSMKTSPIGESLSASARRWSKDPEFAAEYERLRQFEEIARQVIRLRMDHGLTQEQLAERTGTKKSAISRLEAGQHAPTVETLRKIAGAFGGKLVVAFDVPSRPARASSSRSKSKSTKSKTSAKKSKQLIPA